MDSPFTPIDFSGFPLGLDTTSADGALGPGGLRIFRGMKVESDGSIRHAGNIRSIVPASFHVVGFLRWSYGTSRKLLFVTRDAAGANKLYVWDELAASVTRTITIPVYPGTTTNICRFLQAGTAGEVYLLLGVQSPGFGIASRLFYIKDVLTDTVATDVSTVTPGTSAIEQEGSISGAPAGSVGTGNLSSVSLGLAGYQWASVFIDNKGRQSQFFVSPFNAVPLDKQNATLTVGTESFPLDVLHTAIQDGTTRYMDVYRVGGKAAEYRFVKRYRLGLVAGTLSGSFDIIDADTGNPIVDDVSDELLSFITAPTYNDPAPQDMSDITLHQNKIFGIKETGVYFTRTNDFLYWGYDDNGVDDDGGVIFPDNDSGNPFNGLTSTGSLLILGRVTSIYSLYGSGLSGGGGQGFAFDERSNIGNIGRLTLCRVDNNAFYLGRDNLLRTVADSTSPSVSARIERSLRLLTGSALSAAVVCHHQEQVYLSLPTTSVCYVLDTTRGVWREESDTALLSSYLSSEPHPVSGEMELLSAATAGGIYACDIYDNGVYTGTQRSIRLLTDKLFFAPEMVGRIASITIEGTMDAADTGLITCTITAGSVTRTLTLVQNAERLLYYVSLPADLCGRWVTLDISGLLTRGQFRTIQIGTLELRQLV